jgi:hypothetical protein
MSGLDSKEFDAVDDFTVWLSPFGIKLVYDAFFIAGWEFLEIAVLYDFRHIIICILKDVDRPKRCLRDYFLIITATGQNKISPAPLIDG